MSKISDIIEEFILEQLEDMECINLSRNELANFFNCAPSQINYVLSTRFTEPRGFVVESQRGGGGYIRLTKVSVNSDDYITQLLTNTLNDEIDYRSGLTIIENLLRLGYLDKSSATTLSYAIAPKALAMPVKIENRVRSNIIKNVLMNILRGN